MAARELKIVTDHVTCPVCYQLYKDPKVLPCQHSYCQECLSKLEKNKQVTCPECRTIAQVPDGGIGEFKTNFLINRLVDDCILKRKVDGEEKVHCEACIEDDPVTTFCPECVLFMCQACDSNHKRNRNTHQHSIIPLTDLRSKQDIKDKVKPKKQVLLCKKHDIELKFYCETCKELVCLYCTTKDHSMHSHDAIKEVAAKHREQLKKTTAPLKDMITKLSHAHNNISDTKEKMLEKYIAVNKEIDEYFDKILQRITNDVNKQRQQLKQDIQNMVTSKVNMLSLQLKKVEDVQVKMKNVDELAREVEESSNVEMLSEEQQIVHHVSEVTDTFSQLKTDPFALNWPYFTPSYPDVFPQFGSIACVDPLECEIANFPAAVMQNHMVQFTIITKHSKGINPTVQLTDHRNNNTQVIVKDINNGNYTGSFKAELVGHYQLSVSINRQQINGSPHSFFVSKDYSKLNKPKAVINNDGKLRRPWGVAISKDHHWAVSDNTKCCVYIFDQQDRLVKEFGCRGHANGQFCNPRGLSFDDENCLYMVDGDKHNVQKFNVNGDYLLKFGEKGTMEGQLNNPVGITAHLNKVYIAACSNHCISVYQTDGTYCFSFGSQGKGAGQFVDPWDVAIAPDNTLYVADAGNRRIQLFQFDGTFINMFGSWGSGNGQLNFPSSVTVDPNGFILVTEIANNRVSVFDKQQKFLHSFNCQNPYGIAISHTGTIYISTYTSHISVYM